MIVLFIMIGVLNVKQFANRSVSVINIGAASVERTAIESSISHPRSTEPFFNGVQMGLGFLNGTEVVAAVFAVHIESCAEVVSDDFPTDSIRSLSLDGRIHNLKSYGFILISDAKLRIKS